MRIIKLIISFIIIGIVLFYAYSVSNLNYTEILAKGIKPKIKPDYLFPVSKQHDNGCFGYAVKHIADYKYGIKIDVNQTEKKINKPRNSLWEYKHIQDYLKLYSLQLTWKNDAATFFKLLRKGEPVLIQYKWYYGSSWVGHFVAVYSFDKKGVWISESIQNKRVRIAYKDVFEETGYYTDFYFAYLSRTDDE